MSRRDVVGIVLGTLLVLVTIFIVVVWAATIYVVLTHS